MHACFEEQEMLCREPLECTLENDERGTFLSGSQGSNSSSSSCPAAHIEMGSITAASPSSNKNKIEKFETKSGEGS